MAAVLKWLYNNTFLGGVISFVQLSFEKVELGIHFEACIDRLLERLVGKRLD